MAKKENVPTSSMQKSAAPRASLDKHVPSHDFSPPRTPPSQISRVAKGKGRGSKAPRNRPALRNTFEDTSPDVDTEHRRHRSNSHDLSWSPKNTRDSVVDNMLLSLDQFSSSPALPGVTPRVQAPFDQIDPYASVKRSSIVDSRPRGHTISSSISSDYSFHADTPKSNQARGHRSNSSTNFQSTLGRIDSIRLGEDDLSVGEGGEQEYNDLNRRGHTSTNKRGGSKGSGSSSLDFGQVMVGSRWQQAVERRSSSFDNGYHRPPITRNNTSKDSNQDQDFIYDDMDAAPTPTIPVGPRRNRSPTPATGLRSDSSLSQNGPPRRRGSMRSPMVFFGRGDRTDGIDHLESKADARSYTGNNFQDTNSSPLTSDATPGVGRAVSSPLTSTPASANSAKDKDRPGFFKRVFGSSRGSMVSQAESPTQRKSLSQNNARAGSRVGPAPTNVSSSAQSGDAGRSGPRLQKEPTKEKQLVKDQRPQTLNKKSSFFRRRKKSVTESARPPLPPTLPQPTQNPVTLPAAQTTLPVSDQVPGSPVSSLRKVMNAYLDGSERPDGTKIARANEPATREAIRRSSFAQSTIRAIDASEDSETIQLPSFPNFRPSIESPSPQPLTQSVLRLKENSQSSHAGQRRADTARLQHHHRTQSDMDKDLPRLPINYKALDEPENNVTVPNVNQVDAKFESTEVQDSNDAVTPANIMAKAKATPEKSPRLQPQPRDSEQEGRIPVSNFAGEAKTAGGSARTSASTLSDYKSANSNSNSPIIGTVASTSTKNVPELEMVQESPIDHTAEPSQEDRALAQKLFIGEGDIKQSGITAWLGEEGMERGKVRRAYMELFDWKDMNILSALRDFCGHLVLKGETQQVDRVLDSLSVRWCQCNPNHGFKATGKYSKPSKAMLLTSGLRCYSYNLLFDSSTQYRPTHGRNREEDDSWRVHQKHDANDPSSGYRCRTRRFRDSAWIYAATPETSNERVRACRAEGKRLPTRSPRTRRESAIDPQDLCQAVQPFR